MRLPFAKMQASGNDYVCVDGMRYEFENVYATAAQLVDRRFGIGGDGFLVARPSGSANARMQMLNRDGTESPMCGNGLRCLAKYLADRSLGPAAMTIETESGLVPVEVQETAGAEAWVRCSLPLPDFERRHVPMLGPKGDVIEEPFRWRTRTFRVSALSVGNPHVVFWDGESCDHEFLLLGSAMQTDPRFPRGVNVHSVTVLSEHVVRVRTFERGCGETLSCGSGAVAVAAAAIRTGRAKSPLELRTRGGELTVNWIDDGAHRPELASEVREVFRGEVEVAGAATAPSDRSAAADAQ